MQYVLSSNPLPRAARAEAHISSDLLHHLLLFSSLSQVR